MIWRLLAAVVLLLSAPENGRPDPRVDDLRHFRAALLELHPSIHRYSSPAEVDAAFRKAEQELPSVRTDRDFYRLVASLSTVIRDGHTRIRPPAGMQRSTPVKRVHIDGDRVFILAEEQNEARALLSVNGVSSAEVLARAAAMLPRDGFNESYPRWQMMQAGSFGELLGLMFGNDPDLTLGPPRSLAAPGSLPSADGALTFHDDDRIAVLALPTFVPDLGESYRRWFHAIADRRARALIVDLRGNGGGLDRNGAALFAHLADKPFRYYEEIVVKTLDPAPPFEELAAPLRPWRIERGEDGRLRFTGHSCLGEQQPLSPGFRGGVYVLIDGGTFSAASEFGAVAASNRRAVFIGEETGGAAEGNTAGASARLILPHSGIRVELPLMRYEVSAPRAVRGRGVIPDAAVPVTLDDRLKGRDAAFDRAMAMARARVREETNKR